MSPSLSRTTRWVTGLALACSLAATPALAGPPFLTDDPEPTDTGHWEVYGPAIEIDGAGSHYDGAAAVEINYGAARDLQLTVALPAGYAHDAQGWHSGAGDVEIAAKYRIFHDEAAGLSLAVFPGLSVPTASNGMGSGHVTALLPVWFQKDAGEWSLFGGAGYAINPGLDNRDYWTGGIALARQVSDRVLIGVEANREGADADDARASTRLGIGTVINLRAPFRLLASGGPTFPDGGGAVGYHGYVALGLDF